jgi:nucleotide-binding universal stress UspA family protein
VIARILCAVDLHPASDEAIRQADRLARSYKAELTFLHVLPHPWRASPLNPFLAQARPAERAETARQALEALEQKVGQLTGRPASGFSIELEHGVAYARVVERAEEKVADLVVVGAGGESALGTHADRIVRYAHSPVLVARPEIGSSRLLVATDFSDPSLPAVAAGADQAVRRGMKVSLLHSIENPLSLAPGEMVLGLPHSALLDDVDQSLRDAARQKLLEALRRFGLSGEPVVVAGPPGPAILRHAEENEVDLIVVGTAGRTGLKRMLLGSVAETVVRQAPCSVLVVRLHPEGRAWAWQPSAPPGVAQA